MLGIMVSHDDLFLEMRESDRERKKKREEEEIQS